MNVSSSAGRRELAGSGERALASGGSLRSTLSMVERIRPDVSAPIVVFSYVNPIFRLGTVEFARRAAGAGVAGVLALDLPIEEADGFRETLAASGLEGLVAAKPGPRGGHKLTETIVIWAREQLVADPDLRPARLIEPIAAQFGVRVHPRSIERALARHQERPKRH